jgi:hypothetical protein
MNENEVERVLSLLEGMHGLLERIETRLEERSREHDLQRETLDTMLVNLMELVDRVGK